MARTEIPLIVLDPATGNAVVGASVSVKDRVTGNPSTVYAAETGATTVTNPRTTDSYGRVSGWIERGSYQFDISGTGLVSYTEYYESSPGGDGTIDTNWIASSAVTNIKVADGTLTPAKGAQGTFPTFVSTLPSSPVDGQEVYYQSATMATGGAVWHLRYRSGSSSTYKWEFLGGQALRAFNAGSMNTSATGGVYGSLATQLRIQTPLAGEYATQLTVAAIGPTVGSIIQDVRLLPKGTEAAADDNSTYTVWSTTNENSSKYAFISGVIVCTSTTNGYIEVLSKPGASLAWSVANPRLTALPIRVSA